LERSLSLIFAKWLGTGVDVAGLVSFRITNTHARNRILDDLKKKQLRDRYNLVWNSLLSLIRSTDQRRNEIVHWHVINNIDLSLPHPDASTLSLMPPTGWGIPPSPSLNEVELVEFINKCRMLSRAVVLFSMVDETPPRLSGAWLEIFQKPIPYPLPDDYPLSPNYKEPETMPSAS
jgi:hypothetical protein